MTAKLKDFSKLSVDGFLSMLAAPTSTPGGGSASALVAATACALAQMVAGINHRKNNPTPAAASKSMMNLAKIHTRLLFLLTEDARAFSTLRDSLKICKTNRQRDQAYFRAASCVLEICRLCARLADLCAGEKKRTSAWLLSDWREAILLAGAAFDGAWLNVEANLGLIKETEKADAIRRDYQQMRKRIDAYL